MTTHDARTAARAVDPTTHARMLRRLALHFIVPAALVAASIAASSSAHAELPRLPPLPPLPHLPDIKINPPGVYGRIVLGSLPSPPVLFPQPVIVQPAPVAMQAQPLYLYVPPGHANNWSRHCHRYQACNQRVYFVREEWVRERHAMPRGHHPHHHDGYKPAPVYRGHVDRHDHGRGHGHGGHGRGRGHDKDRG